DSDAEKQDLKTGTLDSIASNPDEIFGSTESQAVMENINKSNNGEETIRVELEKSDSSGFGFTMKENAGLYVDLVNSKTNISDECLEPNDQLIEINEVDIRGYSLKDVQELLENMDESLNLIIKRLPEPEMVKINEPAVQVSDNISNNDREKDEDIQLKEKSENECEDVNDIKIENNTDDETQSNSESETKIDNKIRATINSVNNIRNTLRSMSDAYTKTDKLK
ncbi:MAG: Sec7 domain, partial [Paramarteilia canceri]